VSAAERVYRLMLRAYPSAFRAEYGQQMALIFRDRRREAAATHLAFWAAMVADVARSAPGLRLDAARAEWGTDIQIKGGKMKTMAILAIVIGAIEVVNSLVEGWFGGVVNHAGSSLAGEAMGVVAGVVAGALLVAAAIALLRRSSGAKALAAGAAVTCLAVFVLVALLRPMFSIFSTLLGIGFPIVLLVFLSATRGQGSHATRSTAA
jgi:hypothetical protein